MTDYDKLCEKYMIKRVRSFYPRKFDLSPEFIEAFKAVESISYRNFNSFV